MKKTIFFNILAIFLFTGCGNAQKVNIPDVVKKAFTARFPDATKVKWNLEKPGEFEAEFNLKKEELSANFDESGNCIEVEAEIEEAALPEAVKNTLEKEFKGYKFDEIAKSELKGITTFEMEVKRNKTVYLLEFDETGKLLNKADKKDVEKED